MRLTKGADAFVAGVGANVKRKRESRRWSQTTLAGKLKTTHPVVSRIESGKRNMRLSELFEVGRALEVSPADLVTVEPTSL
jgi:transcriptional regulator with XRE-family HTH domain